MDDIQDLSIEINLKSVDYLISVEIVDNSRFVLEIQSIQTAEVWRGCFEANYIEDLTRKTGNFKSFPIFINMLYAALKQDSTTVALDLLTYNDLEILRGKKTTADTSTNSTSRALANNKRYLILTYNVEFDRITYPLHLNYQGVVDAAEQSRTIRRLKEKLKAYEGKGADQYWSKEVNRVEKEKAQLVKDKEALAVEILKIKCETQKHMNNLNNVSKDSSVSTTTQQEIKVLKQMMKSIEESSVKEKNYFQRQVVKRDEELNSLRYEIAQLKTNEKALTNQLKFCEERVRNRSRNNSITESIKQKVPIPRSQQPRRSESPFFNYDYINSKKKEAAVSAARSMITTNKSRWRSSSLDRDNKNLNRNGSRSRGISPASSINSISSIGSQKSRFNPTDYIRSKKEKAKEAELKKKNEIKYRIGGDGNSRQSLRTRSRSGGSNYSYDGREASYAPVDVDRRSRPGRNGVMTTTLPSGSYFNRDEEMKDIDEKLKSLQMLIKNTI